MPRGESCLPGFNVLMTSAASRSRRSRDVTGFAPLIARYARNDGFGYACAVTGIEFADSTVLTTSAASLEAKPRRHRIRTAENIPVIAARPNLKDEPERSGGSFGEAESNGITPLRARFARAGSGYAYAVAGIEFAEM